MKLERFYFATKKLKSRKKILLTEVVLIIFLLLLNGCSALPPIVNYIGYLKTGADSFSYIATKKSVGDHIVSKALEKDCALHRVLTKKEVCVEKTDKSTIALYRKLSLIKPSAGYSRNYAYYLRPKMNTYSSQTKFR